MRDRFLACSGALSGLGEPASGRPPWPRLARCGAVPGGVRQRTLHGVCPCSVAGRPEVEPMSVGLALGSPAFGAGYKSEVPVGDGCSAGNGNAMNRVSTFIAGSVVPSGAFGFVPFCRGAVHRVLSVCCVSLIPCVRRARSGRSVSGALSGR